MSIAAEIEARIADLGSGRLHWVQGSGKQAGDACLIYNYEDALYEQYLARFMGRIVPGVTQRTYEWLNNWWALATAADSAPDYEYGYGAVVWNDQVARSLDQVIDMLAWAWMDAIEEGV